MKENFPNFLCLTIGMLDVEVEQTVVALMHEYKHKLDTEKPPRIAILLIS